ncbi:glycosyltransferase family 4 protein [Paenibacillus sp. GCM10028914]|uniref:glycosyltransferase family 4 protein n=1 Tax=Paenibacillus sp. GCM10028914 TaxID=3273416 RepID=UPI00361AD1E6
MKTRVIIISPEVIGENMSGPAIRYLNFSLELSKKYEVYLLGSSSHSSLNSSISVLNFTEEIVKKLINQKCAIITQGRVIWENKYIKGLNVPIVIDLYDPFILENLETNKGDSRYKERLHEASLSILLEQLAIGDYFICASEKQRDFWIGMLASINRVNALEYDVDPTLHHIIDIVPFGLDSDPPIKTKSVIKGVIPNINHDDIVLLWGGGVWDWLDPVLAIEAMKQIKTSNDKIKLLFMGIRPPNNTAGMRKVALIQEMSGNYSLTGNTVFFNDWVSYEERHNYLLESDIGLSLHQNHLETRFSFRTRMLDYIWCELPTISTRGDVFSEIIFQHQIGEVIKEEDVEGLVNAIQNVSIKNKIYKDNFQQLKKRMTWEEAVKPLIGYLESPQLSIGKSKTLTIKRMSRLMYYYYKTVSLLKDKEYRSFLEKVRNVLK